MDTQYYYLAMVIAAFSIFLSVFMWLQITYLREQNTVKAEGKSAKVKS